MTPEILAAATGADPGLCARYAPHLTAALSKFGISTPQRAAAFIAQIAWESSLFSAVAESFNYSVSGLLATFGTRLTPEQARRLGRQRNEPRVPPERQTEIANLVYANRFGNGPVSTGDGWRYRGGGLKQITFRDNYAACGAALGVDLVRNPRAIEQPDLAALSAGWYWQSRGLNALADRDDFTGITRKINGGLNGLEGRLALWARAKDTLRD